MGQVTANRCDPADRPAALDILYGHLDPFERHEQIGRILEASASGRFTLEGLLFARWEGRPAAAMLTIPVPGRTLIAWVPRVSETLSREVQFLAEDAILEAIKPYGRELGVRMVHVLLGDDDPFSATVLQQHGFVRLTRLLNLRLDVNQAACDVPPSLRTYRTYGPTTHDDFVRVIPQTYIGSLDCPELDGVRLPEEILEGHKAQGSFDPALWFLVQEEQRSIGCLLLARHADLRALEVAYVGLLPSARGRGVGRELTRRAIQETRREGMDQLMLAVDVRNLPARRLYEREGFRAWDARDVYVLLLDPADGAFDRFLGILEPSPFPPP